MEPLSCLTHQWDLCNVTMFNADALKMDLILLQAESLKNEIVFDTPSLILTSSLINKKCISPSYPETHAGVICRTYQKRKKKK